MKYWPYFLIVSLLGLSAGAQPAAAPAAHNPMVDPFAAIPKPEPVAKPAPRQVAVAPPSAPVPPPVVSRGLPAGLRALLIREGDMGLIAAREAGAPSITVFHGKTLRLADQEYFAEVTPASIRLYTSQNGKLLWEGFLSGNVQANLPADTSQIKYVPPLSAGVDPGLGGASGAKASSAPGQRSAEGR